MEKTAYQGTFLKPQQGEPCPSFSLSCFQAYGRHDSFTFPQSGFSLTEDKRVSLSKIGTIKVKMPKGKKANPPQEKPLPLGMGSRH